MSAKRSKRPRSPAQRLHDTRRRLAACHELLFRLAEECTFLAERITFEELEPARRWLSRRGTPVEMP